MATSFERLSDVPPSAQVRGLYFRSFLGILRQAGDFSGYERYFPNESWSSLTYYPLSDYLLRLALAGALITSKQSIHEGILLITQRNAAAFESSVLGRVLLRLLARDPVRLTEQAVSARRQSTTYGEWELVKRDQRCLEMIYRGEYMWIESAIAGAALGSFEACSLKPHLETKLKDKYNGSTIVRW
ncbi:MAG: TIGR02265 family protein [Polyangiaceae bacterium]